jgi:small subunit ribosomal protein S8
MYPLADMLTKIRNAQAVGHLTVEIPFSNLNFEVAKIMQKSGFIAKAEKKGRKINKTIEIGLKYNDSNPVIMGLEVVSKPGQRIYWSSTEIEKVKDGYGIAIMSTSKGLMTNKEARKQKIGGELMCRIW